MNEAKQLPYKIHLNNLIEQHGRTRKWISAQFGVTRVCFWQNVRNDTFTPEEKITIEKIIVNGKAE